MNAVFRRIGIALGSRARDQARPILVWAVWGIMTAGSILFIWHYSRNVPYMDDFTLIHVVTGHDPVSVSWLWSQHNEHRPVISRLILVGLYRFVAMDFRVGLYFNAGLLSLAAASMLLLARRLRGYLKLTDVVLPLSILNFGQAETLLISFALNLILTAWISYELIAVAAVADHRLGWRMTLKLGLLLVLLPLCGGSGLIMLPPLVLWLAAYTVWGCWTGRDLGAATRVVGLAMLLACSAVVAFYMSGYTPPSHHHPPPSIVAVGSTTLEYLSLVVCSSIPKHWRPAALVVVFLVTVTLARLVMVGLKQADERLRALALAAIILSLLATALAVGVARSFIGAGAGLTSRYVTISAPMLCALYFAWLAYGPAPARRLVHITLLVLVCWTLPANVRYGRRFAERRRLVYDEVENCLRTHAPVSVLLSKACPAILLEPSGAYQCFEMLRDARVGCFKYLADDRMVARPDAPAVLR